MRDMLEMMRELDTPANLCGCGCGKPLEPRFDGGSRPQLDGKGVNQGCYDAALPEAPDNRPPGIRGGRLGPID